MWEDKSLFDRIADRLEERKTAYNRFNKGRDSICDYFRPDLGINTDENNRGKFFGANIYEGTAPWAARIAAVGLQGNLVSKSIDWFMYLMKESELRGIDALDIWVQDVKDHMTYVYRQSNFYDVQPNFTLDGMTIGSPVMFGEENILEQKIMWMPQHYRNCYLFYDQFNEVEGIIVEDKTFTAKQIYDEFVVKQIRGQESREKARDTKLSVGLNTDLKAGEFHKEHTIIRAVFKSNDPIWDKEEFKKPAGEYKWLSVYFEELGDQNRKNEPLETMPYFSKPFIVWDYDKKKWEPCSRTPAFDAIYDVASHQQVYKNFLENVQMKNRPPRVVLSTMKGRLRLNPEGTMEVDKEEYDHPPKAVDVIGDVLMNKELSDMLSEAIKRHFHLDLYTLFTNILMQRKQPLTATQIWQMVGEKATLLSPAVETHGKYLKQCDDRAVDIESRAGRGPFAPDVMANIIDIVMSNAKGRVSSIGIVPELIGPLARAQKMQQSLDTIQAGLAAAEPLLTQFPDLKLALKEYDTLDDIFKATNFPMKNLKTEEDYQALLDAVNQMRAQRAQVAQAIEMAKASKNVSGKVEPDSILGTLTGAGAEK